MEETTANTSSRGHAGEAGAARRPARIPQTRRPGCDEVSGDTIYPGKGRRKPSPFWSPHSIFSVAVFVLVVLVSGIFALVVRLARLSGYCSPPSWGAGASRVPFYRLIAWRFAELLLARSHRVVYRAPPTLETERVPEVQRRRF